jgi:hypothetical protein
VTKTFNLDYCFQIYKAAEYKDDKKDNSKYLNRGQFFELLLRLAGTKYKEE